MIKLIIISVLFSLSITSSAIMIWDNSFSTKEKTIILMFGVLINTFLMYVVYSN
jgi:hypothetical protein